MTVNDVFDVEVTREAGYWVAVVRGLRGGATESRRLSDLDVEVRDLISGLLDRDPDGMNLEWHYDAALSGPAVERVNMWHQAQRALEEARRVYDRAQAEVVEQLDREEVSVRDSAALTGLSFQRVQQVRQSGQRVAASGPRSRSSTVMRPAATSAAPARTTAKRAAAARPNPSKSTVQRIAAKSKATARSAASKPAAATKTSMAKASK